MDERAHRRLIVDLEVPAVVGGTPTRLFAYDLSIDGCTVDTRSEPLPSRGSLIKLHLPEGHEIAGRLVWRRDRFGGVQFDERLEYKLIEKLGFRPVLEQGASFRDGFGRHISLPGQRFRISKA